MRGASLLMRISGESKDKFTAQIITAVIVSSPRSARAAGRHFMDPGMHMASKQRARGRSTRAVILGHIKLHS